MTMATKTMPTATTGTIAAVTSLMLLLSRPPIARGGGGGSGSGVGVAVVADAFALLPPLSCVSSSSSSSSSSSLSSSSSSSWSLATTAAFAPTSRRAAVAPPPSSSCTRTEASMSKTTTALCVSIGLGPSEDESALGKVDVVPRLDGDGSGTGGGGSDDDDDEGEEPDHELYRLSRLSKIDERCDEWYSSLLGCEDEEGQLNNGAGMFLGDVSEEARKRIMTLPALVRQPILERTDEEWTPYTSRPLRSSPILPAYGLEQYGLPIPRKNAEAWRHFDVSGMVETDYSGVVVGTGSDLDIDDETKEKYKSTLARTGAWLDDDACTGRLVYVNGRFCPALSKQTDVVRNLSQNDFASAADGGGGVRDEVKHCLSRLTDGFTDELAAGVDDGNRILTSYKKLSGPDHNVGEPTSQFAINGQQGTACFAALNTVRTGAVAFVDVPVGFDEGAERPLPVLIVNARTGDGGASRDVTEDDSKGVACHPRTLAIVGEGSRVSIAQSCVDLDLDSDGDAEQGKTSDGPERSMARLYNGYTQIFVKAGANVTHSYLEETGGIVTPGVEGGVVESGGAIDGSEAREIEANRPAVRDTHLEAIDVHVVGDDGAYKAAVMGLGGSGRSRIALSVSLLRPGAHADVNGFVLAGGAQRTDMRTNIHHVAQGTTSQQAQRNMVGGRATSSFRGRIRVEQSAQQTDSQQLARTILLSDKSRIWMVPSLEIIADDVKCTHGATVSDLSEEELFYLRSRGLDRETSRNLLMYAFADEVSSAVDGAIQGGYDDGFGLRRRCIRRLQNLVPQGERAILGEFQSV